MSITRDQAARDEAVSLVSLLGEARATIVELLRGHGNRTAPELAEDLAISDVAVRKHLAVLESDGFVASETVKQPVGRPVATYHLTERARALYPHRYASMASELLDYLVERHGRGELRAYLNWRMQREASDYDELIDAEADIERRLQDLADALSVDGYFASVEADGDSFRLTQEHCAIYDVAEYHPEMCAYEAAMFKRVLGDDVTLSRRETLASGAHACVCTVTPKDVPTDANQLPIIRSDGGSQ
ncbi:MAG: helix-turn-helix domain-containing protein [Actinobacteria bacterium]|nr:helix-turn-helix domain-containing protein [Actinomycetota bacterium]